MFRLPSLRSLVNGARSRKERRRLAVRNRRLSQRPRLFLEPLEDRTLMAAWAPIGPAPITNGQVAGNLPISGRMTGIAADPGNANILYVATSGGGIWKSINGGTQWTPLTDNLTDNSGNPLPEFMGAVAETTATAGANNGKQIVYGGMGEGNGDGGSFYGNGILVSTNGGTNWTLTTGPTSPANPNGAFYRNTVDKIAIDPNDKTGGTAYAAVSGIGTNGNLGNTGIWKTTTFGQTWENMTAAAPNSLSTFAEWTDVVVDPIQQNGNTVLYAAQGDRSLLGANGVYKSVDSGATWQLLNLVGAAPPVQSPVTTSPNGGNIPAGTYSYVVTAVLPGGETTASNVQTTPALSGNTNSVTLTWSAVAGATAFKVYRSTTSGSFTSPALITTTPDGNTLTFTDDRATPTTGAPPQYGRISLALFDGTFQGNNVNELLVSISQPSSRGSSLYKMYKSLNGGVSFEDLTAKPNTGLTDYLNGQGNFDTTLAISPQNPNYFFAAGAQTQQGPITYSGSPLESFDGGDNWTDIATIGGVGTSSDTHADAFDASGNLLDGTDGGIFKLTNPTNANTQSWSSLNTNLNTIQFVGIAAGVDPNTQNLIVYGGSQDNGTETYTGALGWTLIVRADGGITQVDPNQPNGPNAIVYAEQQNLSLRVSIDGGQTFKTITNGIQGIPPKFYAPYVRDASGNIYYGTNFLNFTNNRGGSWSAIGTPGMFGFNPTGDQIHDIKVLQNTTGGTTKSIVYVSAGNSMFVSQDALAPNATWTPIPLPNNSVANSLNSIAIDPTDTTGGTAYAVVNTFTPTGQQGQHVYYTTNFGAKWDDISGNLPNVPVWSVLVNPTNGSVYVGTDVGVYSTGKGGTNWAKLGTSLPNVQVRELDYVAGRNSLVIGTYGRGAWELGLTVPAPPAPPPVAASIQFTNISVTPNPFALTATETINVNVSQGGGSVSFAVGGQNVTASVDANGNATVTLTVPLLNVLFPQSITAALNGVNASANADITARWFALIDTTKDIVWNLFLTVVDKIEADGTQVLTFSFGGSPLLFIAWTPSGQLKGFGMGAG